MPKRVFLKYAHVCLKCWWSSRAQYDWLVSAYLGHNNRIQSVCFSHQKYPSSISASTATSPHPMLLSASADGSARLWQHGRMEYPLLLFSHHQFNPGSSTSAALTLDTQSSVSLAFHLFLYVLWPSHNRCLCAEFLPSETKIVGQWKLHQEQAICNSCQFRKFLLHGQIYNIGELVPYVCMYVVVFHLWRVIFYTVD